MSNKISLLILIILLTSSPLLMFALAESDITATIYIRADGQVDPPSSPIQYSGDTYTLTGNILNQNVEIEKDHITVDGSGFSIKWPYQGIMGAHFRLNGRSDVTIKNVEIEGSGAIDFYLSSNCQIIGSSFNHVGISVSSSSNILISNNKLTNNSGIGLGDSSDNIISGNTIVMGNHVFDDAAIGLSSSSGNSILENNITGDKLSYGIQIRYSDNNIISKNNIIDNYEGIFFLASGDISLPPRSAVNIVSSNNIAFNKYGIDITSYNHETFTLYHNNFIQNQHQTFPYDGAVWDNGYPSGGNYWDDYKGKDEKSGPNQDMAGSDGIGDTPYVISAGPPFPDQSDRYPLMTPIFPLPESNQPNKNEISFNWTLLLVILAVIIAIVGVCVILFRRRINRKKTGISQTS